MRKIVSKLYIQKTKNYIPTFIYQSFVLKYSIFVDNLYRILLSTINNE